MLADVQDADGTGTKAAVKGFQICAKTGTAQVQNEKNQLTGYNFWFASFAPYENPKYSVVVMMEGMVMIIVFMVLRLGHVKDKFLASPRGLYFEQRIELMGLIWCFFAYPRTVGLSNQSVFLHHIVRSDNPHGCV